MVWLINCFGLIHNGYMKLISHEALTVICFFLRINSQYFCLLFLKSYAFYDLEMNVLQVRKLKPFIYLQGRTL